MPPSLTLIFRHRLERVCGEGRVTFFTCTHCVATPSKVSPTRLTSAVCVCVCVCVCLCVCVCVGGGLVDCYYIFGSKIKTAESAQPRKCSDLFLMKEKDPFAYWCEDGQMYNHMYSHNVTHLQQAH